MTDGLREIESAVGRPIDEIDMLNMLGDDGTALLESSPVDDVSRSNAQHRIYRIDQRMALAHALQVHIEIERLKRRPLMARVWPTGNVRLSQVR